MRISDWSSDVCCSDLPGTPMHHRMVTLMACGFAITACYALGLGVQALDVTGLRAPLIALLALVVLMAVRYYRLPPPGPVFFVMAAAIGAYTPEIGRASCRDRVCE